MSRGLMAIVLLLASALASIAQLPEKADPLVGKWIWQHDGIAVFSSDGTSTVTGGFKGNWQYLHNSEVQRKYRFVWNDGAIIDKAVMSEDQKTILVQNDKGERYMARRAIPTP